MSLWTGHFKYVLFMTVKKHELSGAPFCTVERDHPRYLMLCLK